MGNSGAVLKEAQDAIVDYGLVAYSTKEYVDLTHKMAGHIVYLLAIIHFNDYKVTPNSSCEANAESCELAWKEQYPAVKGDNPNMRG